MNLTVAKRKKVIVNTQKKIRKESKHNTKENHKNTREENKRRGIERRGTTKIARKQLRKWQYIPINTYFKCKWTKFANQNTQSR